MLVDLVDHEEEVEVKGIKEASTTKLTKNVGRCEGGFISLG